MRFFNVLATLLLPLFILTACTGTGATSKDEMLRLARTQQPNTAVIFWDNRFVAGLERIVFAQDDVHKGAISPGQVLAVPLQPGANEFFMNWEELLDLPTSTPVTLNAKPDGPSFFIIREVNAIVFRSRGLEPVSRGAFLAAVQQARVAEPEGEPEAE
ncbi:MAG: hypothetical protein AAFY25_13710 [Pseudomonadota bacterium]